MQSGFRASFGKINVCNQSRHNEGSHSASHSAMLGLDYSSSDEDGDDSTKVHAPTVAAEAEAAGWRTGMGAADAAGRLEVSIVHAR